MTVSVQEKIEQIKQKKYAYQWDITLVAPLSSVETTFDRIIAAYADIFDHLSSGPKIVRPAHLGKGGKELFTIDFSLQNAWGNGLFFQFGEPGGNPRDGYYANLWCEFVGIADTRLYIERAGDVFAQMLDENIMTVQPTTLLRISLATNQGWAWQEMVWHGIRDRLEKEGYTDETLHLQSRVKLFDTLKEMQERAVLEKLHAVSEEKIIDKLNNPPINERQYFRLRMDRYIDIDETINVLQDRERIRVVDISMLGLTHVTDGITQFTRLKDVYAEYNELKEFPEAILNMPNIEKLLLGYNHISSIPSTIAQLQQLTLLSLNNNELTELPEVIGSLGNLEVLQVAYNKLTKLPDSLKRLEKLRRLQITGNQLTAGEVIRIKKMLPQCMVENEKSVYEKMIETITAKYRQESSADQEKPKTIL